MQKKITRYCVALSAFLLLTVTSYASLPSSPSVPKTDTAAVATTPDKAAINSAVAEFKSLSAHDKKMRMKEVKKLLKEYKADKKKGKSDDDTNSILMAILCILLPPLAVGLHEGELDGKFWLSVLLTLLFWLPGIIYAFIVVFG